MIRVVGLLVSTFYVFGASAQEPRMSDTPAYVVKVRSGFCSNPKEGYEGTGEVFRKDGKRYVLTSEHAVLHGNEKICHSVESPQLPQTKVTLVAPDVGEGVALLRLPDNVTITAPEMDDLFDMAPLQRSEDVRVDGYIYSSNEPASGLGGYVYQAQSQRHRIPHLKHAIEIVDAHGEAGISGGRVARPNSDRMAAMTSHQYLEHIAGETSPTREYKRNGSQKEVNHLILIPADRIRTWVRSYFDNPQGFKAITRDPDLQVFDVPAFFTEGLMLKLIQPPASAKDESKDRTNTGGPEGVRGRKRKPNPVWVQVEKDPNPQKHQAARRSEQSSEWVKDAHEKLELADTRLEVRAVVERNDEGDIERAPFEDLSEFLMKLSNPNNEPAMIVPEKLGRRFEEKTMEKLVELGKQIMEKTLDLKKKIKANPSESTNAEAANADRLLERINLVGELLWSDWEILRVSDIKRVTFDDPRHVAEWDYLLLKHRNEASDIVRALLNAEKELGSVTP